MIDTSTTSGKITDMQALQEAAYSFSKQKAHAPNAGLGWKLRNAFINGAKYRDENPKEQTNE